MSARQAQAVKPGNHVVSEQESLQLTRNLLRIAMFNISYIRGLFPEKYFDDKFVPALEMKVKKLLPLDMESKRLIDWMEKGAFDALQKKYLRTLFFTICGADDGPLVEEYIFSFSYSKDPLEDITSMTIDSSNGKTVKRNTFEHLTPHQMKNSACKMVRTLVQLMRTLGNVPEERTIIMKLHYYDDVTPPDYEPPFFTSSTYEDPSAWSQEPLKMKVGHVDSKHYKLAIKVKSIFDPCLDEDESEKDAPLSGPGATSDDESSGSEANALPSQKGLAGDPVQKITGVNDLTASRSTLATEASTLAKKLQGMHATEDAQAVDSDNTQDSKYEGESLNAIREWLQLREVLTVDMSDILGEFPQISLVLIEELVEQLVEDGLLTTLGKDLFHINRPLEVSVELQLSTASYAIGLSWSTRRWLASFEKDEVQQNLNELKPVLAVSTPKDAEMLSTPEDDKSSELHFYKKALLHTLPLEYITIPQLQAALNGVSRTTACRFMAQMSRDGFIENTPKNRRLGRRVLHSREADAKLQEVRVHLKMVLQKTAPEKQEQCDIEIKTSDPKLENSAAPASKDGDTRQGSTYGRVQTLGSELTEQGETPAWQDNSTANGTSREPGGFKKPLPPDHPRNIICQPTTTAESAHPKVAPYVQRANGTAAKAGNKSAIPTVMIHDSQSSLDSCGHEIIHCRCKASKADGPIYQPPFKRIRKG